MFFTGHTVAAVTFFHVFVTKMQTMCSPLIGQFSSTMIVASSDKVWLYRPINIQLLETVLSHLTTLSNVLV